MARAPRQPHRPLVVPDGAIGFDLRGPDNYSFMLGDSACPRCPGCGLPVDKTWINPDFRPRHKRWDIASTYDGYTIVSERFRGAVANTGARCLPLPASPGFYVLVADEHVPFDPEARRTVFVGPPCGQCGRHLGVHGATPAPLRVSEVPPDRIVRSDIEFGHGDEQSPLLIAGIALASRLKIAGLRGLDLSPVFSSATFRVMYPRA